MALAYLRLTAALLVGGVVAAGCTEPSGPSPSYLPAASGQASPAQQRGGLTGTLPQAQGGTMPHSGTLQQTSPNLPPGIHAAPGRDVAPQLDTQGTRPVVPGQSMPR